MADRRDFLKSTGSVGLAGLVGLAGCTGGGGNQTGGSSDGASDGSSGDGSSGDGSSGDGSSSESTDTPTEEPTDSEPAYNNGELNFIMSPSEPQDLMEKQYQPVKSYLDDQLSVPTSLKYARNYSAVLQALDSGTGDVAETGPFAAAIGVNADKCGIALQRYAYGSWDYSSVIVTKADSDIESLSDLQGKSVALADRLSASGSLFPLYMLKQAGVSIGNLPTGSGDKAGLSVNYAGGHSAAFSALDAGQVDAAGVGKFITLNDDRELKEGFRYVKTYDGIPRAPVITSPTLSESEKTNVVDALKNAPESMYLGADGEEGTDDDLWFSDVRPADLETYEPVIDVAEQLGVKIEDFN